MTNKELRTHLEKYPDDMNVMLYVSSWGYEINNIDIEPEVGETLLIIAED